MLINDRYELRKEIRRGGFGVTWYAWDTNLDMPVAVKEFSDPDPEHRRKFIREARSLAKVSGSRGIVNVRDYLEFDGRAYMVMEYLDGEDLSARIDRTGRLSLDETWQLLLPVMSVLTKLHKADMIHRDVSPDNIRITGDGEVKLLDFGSVSNLTSEHLTRTVTVKPGYAPIEQYSGAAEQGPWTDEYSLCATIYKCITGRKPVDSLVRSFHDELERPSALGVKISREEEDVLMKGLSVNPRERYGSIDDLVNAMESAGSRSQHSSSVRSSVEDLAAKAFSDEAQTSKEEPETTMRLAQSQNIAQSAQSRNVVQPAVQPAAPVNSAQSRNVVQPTVQPAAPVQAGQSRNNAQPVQPAQPGTAPQQTAQSARQPRRKKNKFIIPCILAGALVLGVAGFAIFSGGSGNGGNGGGGGVLPIPITTGSAEGIEYKSGESYAFVRDTTINDAHIDFIRKNDAITSVYFDSCSIPDEMISRMAEWTKVEKIEFDDCEGFTSLDPLAGMAALKTINIHLIWGEDNVFAGDQFFTADFPETMTSFYIICDTLEGTTGFLRHFPGVSTLSLNVENGLDDYSFLDSMPNLQYLYLNHMSMDEEACSHLGGHKELSSVQLDDGSLASLEWAKDCPKIRYIIAQDCPITDLSPLAGNESLYQLSLPGSQVSDLTPLASCPKLGSLNVSRSQVSSLEGLENAQELSTLNISRCGVSDLTPLSGCPNLRELYADHNKITSLSAISKCDKMLLIDVSRNELSTLDGCQDMIKLTSLKAVGNHIADISGIRNSTLLSALMLSENEITDISALSNNFVDLKVLDVSNNQISDISALAGCASLEAFAADNNRLMSVSALADKHSLYGVFLSNNELSDITPLRSSMDNLSYLDIGSNSVRDISFLNSLSVKRVWLLMENNNISDISMLPAKLNYQKLVFYGNPIQDVSVISEMQDAGAADFYVSYHDNIDYSALGASPVSDEVSLVDVPSEKKASVLKQFKENTFWEPAFKSSEEADEEIAAFRAEIRKQIIGDSGADDTENAAVEDTEAESSAEVTDEATP